MNYYIEGIYFFRKLYNFFVDSSHEKILDKKY